MANGREDAKPEAIPLPERESARTAPILGVIPEPIRSWLEKAHDGIAERPWIEKPLEAALVYTLTRIVDGLVKSELEDAFSWLMASSLIAVPLIADPEFDSILVVCVFAPFLFAGADVASDAVSRHVDLLAFCIGVPVLMMLNNFSSLTVLRQHIPYSCSVFLGAIAGYAFIIKGASAIGLSDELGLPGYFIAMTIGLVLAIEMPITYRRHETRNLETIKKSTRVPTMVPLTFPIGLIMGIVTVLVLYAMRLLLIFGTLGYILVLPFAALVFYGLRPR
jgi:hypothetical protein